MCEIAGNIVSRDINYALILDRMYKGKLKDGDLDAFSKEDIEKMESDIARKRKQMQLLKEVSDMINL